MGIDDTLAKQAPRARLRPIGLNDLQITEAMKVVFKIKPVPLSMKDQQKMDSSAGTLLNTTADMTLQKGTDEFHAITSKFFPKTSIKRMNGGAQAASTWYDKHQEYVLSSADKEDTEAAAVRHLTYVLLGI
jgi:hypothetical protein